MRRLATLLLLPSLTLAVAAQESPKKEKRTDLPADDAIWGYGWIGGPYPVGGPKPVAAPILPQDWIVMPADAGDGRAEMIARAFDPAGRAPTGREPLASDAARKWESRRGQPVAGAICAFTSVRCEKDEVRMARLSGAGLLLVNGSGFIGDPEQRGDRGVPIALHAGANELYVFDIRGPFELELWAPRTRTVFGAWDVCWPKAFTIFLDDLTFPVFNASLFPASGLDVHYGEGHTEGGATKPVLSQWCCGGHLLPLGLRMGGTNFIDPTEPDLPTEDRPAVAPVCVWSDGDEDADRQLLRWPGKEGRAANTRRHASRREDNLLGTPFSRAGLHSLLVYGSQTSLERARFDQESIWYRAGYVPGAIEGEELLNLPPPSQPDTIDWDRRSAYNSGHHVLYGNAETNKAWSHFVAADYPIQVHEGHLSVNGKEFTGDDICGWFLLKRPAHYDVLVIADTGARGARLGYLVQPLLSDASDLEYAFWDARGPGGGPRMFVFANRQR
jgi:hypothetical protein